VVQVKRCRNYDERVANSEWRVAIRPLIPAQAGIQPGSPLSLGRAEKFATRFSPFAPSRAFCLSMIFSENRRPLFRIMH